MNDIERKIGCLSVKSGCECLRAESSEKTCKEQGSLPQFNVYILNGTQMHSIHFSNESTCPMKYVRNPKIRSSLS